MMESGDGSENDENQTPKVLLNFNLSVVVYDAVCAVVQFSEVGKMEVPPMFDGVHSIVICALC